MKQLALLLCLVCSAANAAAPEVFQRVGVDQHLNQALPLNLMFTTTDGKSVPLRQFFDNRPVLLVLGYRHCPNLCGVTRQGIDESLRQTQLRADRDFVPVFVDIDPNEPSEAALAPWRELHGDARTIETLARAVGFRYLYDEQLRQYAHPAGFIIATPTGRIARYFFGVRFEPRELRLGLVEAAHGQIGNLADQLLLLCYHYDPLAGRYNVAILSVLRIGAVVFALGLAVSIWRMSRRRSATP